MSAGLLEIVQKMFSQGGKAVGLPPAQQSPQYNLMGRIGGNKDANKGNSILDAIGELLQSFLGFSLSFKNFLKGVNPGMALEIDELTERGCHPDDASTMMQYISMIEANNPDVAKSINTAIRQDKSPQLGSSWARILNVLCDLDMKKEANQLLHSREAVAKDVVTANFAAASGIYNNILQNISEVGFDKQSDAYQRANVVVRRQMLQAVFVARQQANQPGANLGAIDNALAAQLRGLWNAHHNTHNAEIQGVLTGERLSQTEAALAERLKKAEADFETLTKQEQRYVDNGAAVPAALTNQINAYLPALVQLQDDRWDAEIALKDHQAQDLIARHAHGGLRAV